MDVLPLSATNFSDKETWPVSHNPEVCNLWGYSWQLLTAEMFVSTGDQAWIRKKKKKNNCCAIFILRTEQAHKYWFPKMVQDKRSYFHSSKPWCLSKVLWSYFTQGICVLL